MKIKNKLIIKNILIAIFIFIFGIHLLSFYVYFLDLGCGRSYCAPSDVFSKYRAFLTRDISIKDTDNTFFSAETYRPIENEASSKKPIALFGCSFVYGTGLENNQTFSYKLGKETGRPIYNRAKDSWGAQHTLYQFSNPKLYEIVPEPEYIIYLFFNGLYTRMYAPCCYICPQSYIAFYSEKDSHLILNKRTYFSDKVIPISMAKNKIVKTKLDNKQVNEIENFMLKHFEEIKKYQNEKWPNSKFIIFFYDEPLLGNASIKKLEDLGYISLRNEDLGISPYTQEYKLPDDHPSEKFWNDVVPIIVKQYNL